MDRRGDVRPSRVVLCEDSDDTREILEVQLTQRGISVCAVSNGAAAIRAIIATEADAAIVDLTLGSEELAGLQVARVVRKTLALPGIRLVALTGFGDERRREAARAAGFDAYLVKPATVDEMLTAIEPND